MDMNYIFKLLLIFGILFVSTGTLVLFLNKINPINLNKTRFYKDGTDFISEIINLFFLVFAVLFIMILTSSIGYVVLNY